MPAKKSARSRLKSGPAIATMILSSAEIRRQLRAIHVSTVPSMMSIGASCGSATKPPKGSEPSEYCTPLIVLLPKRFAEPDAEFFDHQPAPARGEEVPQLMHDDEQVKEDDDLEDDEDDAKSLRNHAEDQ